MSVVEWYEKEVNALIDKYEAKEISKRDFIVMKHNLFYPAKAMEKEQKIEFAKHCLDKSIDLDILMAYNQVEIEYTNQTFKSE